MRRVAIDAVRKLQNDEDTESHMRVPVSRRVNRFGIRWLLISMKHIDALIERTRTLSIHQIIESESR